MAMQDSSGASGEGSGTVREEMARRSITSATQEKPRPSPKSKTRGLKMQIRHESDIRAETQRQQQQQQPDLVKLDAELRRRSLRRVPRSDARLAARRDRESLGELVRFLTDVPPPPTNRMSVPDPTWPASGRSSESSSLRRISSTKRRTGIKRAFGLLMRRGSTKKPQRKSSPATGQKTAAGPAPPARQPSTTRKKSRPPRIKLPDSAVAGRTIEGYRHIAISIPIEHAHLSPAPRHHAQIQIRNKRSRSRSRSLTSPHTSSGHLAAPPVRPVTAAGPSSPYQTSHLGPLVEQREHPSPALRAKVPSRDHGKGESAAARKVRLTSRHTFGTLHESVRRSAVLPELASLSVPPRTSEEKRRSAAHKEALEALVSGASASPPPPLPPPPQSPSWCASPGLARPFSAYSFPSSTSETAAAAASPPPVPVPVPVPVSVPSSTLLPPPTARTHRRHHSGSSGKRRRPTDDSIDSSLDHTFRESIFSDLSCIEGVNTNGSSSEHRTAMVREAQPARRFEGAEIVECASPRSSSEAPRRSRSRGGREARPSGMETASIAGAMSQASNYPVARAPLMEILPGSAARNNSMRAASRPQSIPRQPSHGTEAESSLPGPGDRSRSKTGRIGTGTRTPPLVHEDDDDDDDRNEPYSSAQSEVEEDYNFEGFSSGPELASPETDEAMDDEPHDTRVANLQVPPVPPERVSSRKAVQTVPAAAAVALDQDSAAGAEIPAPEQGQHIYRAMSGSPSSRRQAEGSKPTELSRKQRFEQLRRALERPDAQPSDLLWERRPSVSSNGSADFAMLPTARNPDREDVLFLHPSIPATPPQLRPESVQPALKLTNILTVADVEPSSPYSACQPRLLSGPVSTSTKRTTTTVIRTPQPSPQYEDQPATPPGSPPYSASTTSRFSTADADRSPVYHGPLVPPKRAKPTLFRRYSSASYTQGLRESSLPRPKTAGKRSAASEKNFFAGAAVRQRVPVASGGRSREEDVFLGAEALDIRDRPTFKLTRSQIFERYEALREKQTQDLERRLRRLEHTEDHWLASMLPLLTDLNKVIARLHLPRDEEEERAGERGRGVGAGGSESGRPPYDVGPRGVARRVPRTTRSGVAEEPPRSSHDFQGRLERHDWNTEDMYRGIPERHRPFQLEQEQRTWPQAQTRRHHSKSRNTIRPARWSTPDVPPNADYGLGVPSASAFAFQDRDFPASASAIDKTTRPRSSLPGSRSQSMQGPRLFHDTERMAQRDIFQERLPSSLKNMFPDSFASEGERAASVPPGETSLPTDALQEDRLEMTWPSRPSFDSISSLETYDDTSSVSGDVAPVPRQRIYHHHRFPSEDDEVERQAGREETIFHQFGLGSFQPRHSHQPTAPYRAFSGSTGMESIEPLMRELQATGSRLSGESYEYEDMGDDEVRKMRQRPGPRAVVNLRAFK